MSKKVVVNPEESALVVEDMQKDFCYEDGALFMGEGAKEIIPRIRRLIEKGIQKKVHLIFAQDWHSPASEEFEIWGQHCVPGTRGAEIVDELSPFLKEAYVVKKEKYTDFFGTDLDLHLKEKGIKTLIIVGVATNICVMHTAIDASLRGYELILPEDCVAALSDYEHEYGLRHIKSVLNATITSSGNIIF
ncbi:MAG: cysteine hydrolase [Methanophagales archaeon]|nr:cysteine hydrolase [Methanophagales archaeon]RLG35132.1 MAG: cysteine hydrolase [Methanosarcinales archaeon]